MHSEPIHNDKVIAYIVRDGCVLVFEHRDQPEAGVQVPAGTVEPGEPHDAAVLREVHEESGLACVRIERLIDRFAHSWVAPGDGRRYTGTRSVYLLALTAPVPDAWSHAATGSEEENGLIFVYRWLPFAEAASALYGQQGLWLSEL